MKRSLSMMVTLMLTLALALCAGLPDRSYAEDGDTPFFHNSDWDAEDVDVSGVREENGRLVGEIGLPAVNRYGRPSPKLLVDCPMPADFTAEQRATLHVRHRKITSKQLLAGLEAVLGRKPAPDNGNGYAYNDGRQTIANYVSEKNIDSYFFWGRFCDTSLSDDPAYAAEYAQAKNLTRRLIAHFGGSVCESLLHANRRDSAHAYRYSDTESSEGLAQRRAWEENFAREEAEHGRTEQPYTPVCGLYELMGLPVADQYYWRDGGDWIGAESSFQTVVRDDGGICHAAINGLVEFVSAEPLDLPAFDWRALLRNAVAKLSISNAHSEDQTYENADGETCVSYASYAIITDLKPCWVGMTADTLVPGWYCVTEERVCADDSVIWPWSQYGDYAGLME